MTSPSDSFRALPIRSDSVWSSFRFTPIRSESFKFVPVHLDPFQFNPIRYNSIRFVPIHSSSTQFAPIHSDSLRSIPTIIDSFRFILIHSDSFRFIPIHSESSRFFRIARISECLILNLIKLLYGIEDFSFWDHQPDPNNIDCKRQKTAIFREESAAQGVAWPHKCRYPFPSHTP